MSIDTDITETTDRTFIETIGEPDTAPEHVVEVRRRPGVAAALGASASLVAVAYLARAGSGGSVLDWTIAGVLGLIGIANLVIAQMPGGIEVVDEDAGLTFTDDARQRC